MQKYIVILYQLFVFQFKHLLAYRLNGILRLLNYPSFTLGSFLAIYTAYQISPTVAGWNYSQTMILFLTYHLITSLSYMLFFEGGVRRFLYWGVRSGEFDFVLTKPINPQFLAMFGRPYLDGLSSVTVVMLLTIYLYWTQQLPVVNLYLLPIFVVSIIAGITSYYFFCAGMATIAFYVSSGGEVVELISKLEEAGQRPLAIYPQFLQFLALTVIPFGLIAYVPASLLLSKISWQILVLSCSALPISYFFNRLMWAKGLRHYASASS